MQCLTRCLCLRIIVKCLLIFVLTSTNKPLRRPLTVMVRIPDLLKKRCGKTLKKKVMDALTGVVAPTDIKCIQPMGGTVRVTLSSVTHKNTLVSADLSCEGMTLPVRKAEISRTFVQIHRLPYEVPDNDLVSLLPTMVGWWR